MKRQKRAAVKTPALLTFLQLPFFIFLLFLIKLGTAIKSLFQKTLTFIILLKDFFSSKSSFFTLLKHQKKKSKKKKLFPFAYFHPFLKNLHYLIPKTARVKVTLSFVFILLIFYSFLIINFAAMLPSPVQLTTTHRPLTTEIYDRNGILLYQFYEGRNRKLIQLSEVSPYLINATIAIEDKHFFSHPGLDFIGIIRAAWVNITEGKNEGGSTLTQQLIKNTLLTPEQTWNRKIKEAILSFWVERIYSKEEILTMYFNEVPYGGPAWGAEAAAQMYFGKEVRNLTLAESAYLAGLPAAPTQYSPYGIHPEKGKQRQMQVLTRMVEDGYITKGEADKAANENITFISPAISIKAPHFVMYVRSILAAKYGERTVSQGGLKVITSLDLGIQEMAEDTVKSQVDKLDRLKVGNGAAMVMDAQTGQILAMVGSKDYFNPGGGNFNVSLALRQPGSSIKPITYVTAFKQGFFPGTILLDVPTTFPNPWGKAYTPVNYDERFHGAVTIRTALGSSYNIPAVKILAMIGLPSMIETAQQMGITTFEKVENYGLSLTLGGGAVKMIDLMTAYTTLASLGTKYTPTPILAVTDSFGNKLEDSRKIDGKKVLTEEVSYLINHILADNNARTPAFGAGSLLNIPKKTVAVKTGTSDDKRDNWTFGYTPEYVVGTWVGNNDYSPMDQKLASGITGAAPIWHEIMANLLEDRPDIAFKRPPGIVETIIDGKKDLAISGQIPKQVVGYQRVKNENGTGGKDIITYTDQFSRYTFDPN